ncbi:hypothetical protein C8J57DRAFT_1234169 [Mycena rebaudengoi]|nr:hypothetical protein C8J57DRAFT_1234169 [Mycena rebaudengoi]
MFRAGDIVEIGLSIVVFKGHRDNKGFVRLVMNSLVFLDSTHTRDARVAERMAAMSMMQMVRIKPTEHTKQKQVYSDETDGEEKDRNKQPIFNFLNNTEQVVE